MQHATCSMQHAAYTCCTAVHSRNALHDASLLKRWVRSWAQHNVRSTATTALGHCLLRARRMNVRMLAPSFWRCCMPAIHALFRARFLCRHLLSKTTLLGASDVGATPSGRPGRARLHRDWAHICTGTSAPGHICTYTSAPGMGQHLRRQVGSARLGVARRSSAWLGPARRGSACTRRVIGRIGLLCVAGTSAYFSVDIGLVHIAAIDLNAGPVPV